MKRIEKTEVVIHYDDGTSKPSLSVHYGDSGGPLCFPVYQAPAGYKWLLVREDKFEDAIDAVAKN